MKELNIKDKKIKFDKKKWKSIFNNYNKKNLNKDEFIETVKKIVRVNNLLSEYFIFEISGFNAVFKPFILSSSDVRGEIFSIDRYMGILKNKKGCEMIPREGKFSTLIYEIEENFVYYLAFSIFNKWDYDHTINRLFLLIKKSNFNDFVYSVKNFIRTYIEANNYIYKLRKENDIVPHEVFLRDNLKENICEEIEDFMGAKDLYKKKLKIPWKYGIFLYGPPGNGKTSLIKYLKNRYRLSVKDLKYTLIGKKAQKAQGSCISENTSDMPQNSTPMWLSKTHLDNIFFEDRIKPDLYYLEDVDKIIDKDISLDEVTNFIDGIEEESDGFLFIATANDLDGLHSAIKRPGRFDSLYEIGFPTRKQIKDFLDWYKFIPKDTNIEKIIDTLEGNSMAKIELFVKLLKSKYKKNKFNDKEIDNVLNKIEDCTNKEKEIIGFGDN